MSSKGRCDGRRECGDRVARMFSLGGFSIDKPTCSGFTAYMQERVDLGKAVLKGVSRSFYLTIRLLPRLMREPVSVGYLLARASDTIADTESVPAEVRKDCLTLVLKALKDEDVRDELCALLEEKFIRFQENEREKLLLESLEDVYGWYDSVREVDWKAIAVLLEPIVAGQSWDVDYFGIQGKKQIESAKALENYCYQVAGSVGEFWGVIGKHSYSLFSEAPTEELQKMGVSYGKGLQLVNILRDLPVDISNGRCYIPNVDPEDNEAVMEAAKEWRIKARKYLEQGLLYSSTLRQKRAKMSTVLPAIMGLKTLDLLDAASWEEWQEGIKISRKEVRKSLIQAVFYK